MARFPWKVVAASGLALGVLGAGLSVARALDEKRRPTPKRIALIGDSYAVGLGPELAKLFPDFKFEGHVGTTTSAWASHSKMCGECGDWLPEFKPDLVLVSLGVNDGNKPNMANYQTLVKGLHGLGARVVWIEPPKDVWTPNVRNAIASLGVPTIPATNVATSDDGIHPQSYVPWAHEIAEAMARV